MRLASWILPFVLVLYLALESGGFDIVAYSQVGILAWWLLILGAVIGILPTSRLPRAGWAAALVLLGIAAWTAAAIGWSESAERTVVELGRVASLLGVFVLAIAVQGRAVVRSTVNAVGAAIAIVAVLALLSRLRPDWFPTNEAAQLLEGTGNRLNYPLNYWNALGALCAIGVPLLLVIAAQARTLIGRGLAAAAVPVVALTAFFTLSRGGAVAALAGVLVLLALYPRRLALLPTVGVAAIASAILISAAASKDDLADGLMTAAASAQADEMIVLILVTCAVAALVAVALGVAARREIGPRPEVPRRVSLVLLAGAAVVAIVFAIAVDLPGELSDRWEEFKQPGDPGGGVGRLESAGGNDRYQIWSSALDAYETEGLTGIGPGTFEFWWARDGTSVLFLRDAHSLYLETLAEAGPVGLILIVALIGMILVLGASRALRRSDQQAPFLAAATAGAAAFALAAGIDWAWEVTVLPVAFLLLAAAIACARKAGEPARVPDDRSRGLPVAGRAGVALLGVVALVAIAIPMAGATAVRESQEAVRLGDLEEALEKASDAEAIQPYAASPQMQRALVLSLAGELDDAAAAAREATRAESTNWRTWFVLARIEGRRGRKPAEAAAYSEARSLNPRSPLFTSSAGAAPETDPAP